MLLVATFWAQAQDAAHWTYQGGQYENETYVYADVTAYTETTIGSYEENPFSPNDYGMYEYAAFVNGELRAIGEVVYNNQGDSPVYLVEFRVEGGADDMNSAITFKAYDRNAAKEYDLSPSTETPVFTGETIDPGIPSNPLHLQITFPLEATPVSSITTPFFGYSAESGEFLWIDCSVGDDLTPYFIDGKAFAVGPEDATNKDVTFSLYPGNVALEISETGAITATSAGGGMIKVTSVDNPQVSCIVFVFAHNDYTQFSFTQEELRIPYKDQVVEFSGQLMNLGQFLPEGAQTIPTDIAMTYESSNPEVAEINDNGAFAYQPGEAEITFKLPVVNYLMRTFEPNSNHTTYSTSSIRIVVYQIPTGLQVEWPTDLATFQQSTIVIKPLPEGAEFNPDGMLTVSGQYESEDALAENVNGVYEAVYTPVIPGMMRLTVTYDDMTGNPIIVNNNAIEVGYTFPMYDGWQWRTIPYGYPGQDTGLEAIFGDELVEIRTQSAQLYNDPVYGYFGNQQLLSQNVAFKLKMNISNSDEEHKYVFYGGSLGNVGNGITLRHGWNYLPNPFVTTVVPSQFFAETVVPVEGDRLVAKSGGFIEYTDGQWVGDLTQMQVGEGFLFYNPGETGRTVSFATHVNAIFEPDLLGSPRLAPNRAPKTWNYDASRFRDNMTIVAQVNEQSAMSDEQWSIGAFVGDECRGEGHLVDGKFFITVQAEGGELISFKLRDEVTGQLFDIDQTVRMQQMLGTVKQPLALSANVDTTTGIRTMDNVPSTTNSYDLGGRRIGSNGKGIQLQRASDGKVRKVIR